MKLECYECERSDVEVRLRKCPICFRHYCEEHAYQRSGVSFCSRGCSEYFFHVDPDD